MEFVYIISAEGLDLIKIGRSNRAVEHRLFACQVGSPARLKLEFVFETENSRRLERHVHGLLHERRSHGEWFKATLDEAKAAIATAHASRVCDPLIRVEKTPQKRGPYRPRDPSKSIRKNKFSSMIAVETSR